MKKLLFFLCFLISLSAQSQISKMDLSLEFHDGNGPFEYQSFHINFDDTSAIFKNTYPEIKGVPKNIKNIKKGIILFNFIQYVYQNYLAGKIDKPYFLNIKKMIGADYDENLPVGQVIKCFVAVISGTDEDNETICIVDANNNYDFSDDIVFKPENNDLPDSILNKGLVEVACQRVLNGVVINDIVPLLITESSSFLLFSIAQYATADLSIGKENYKLAVRPLYFHSRSWIQTQLILMDDSPKVKPRNQNQIINNGEFITVNDDIFRFNRVEITKNSLVVQKMSSSKQSSAQVGFQAPGFTGKNLLTESDISLQAYRGKYVLIDFWGTWCQPCREQLPALVKLNTLADTSKFTTISIASSDDLNSLRKVIAEEVMSWPQILSDEITNKYNVNAFPSSFLVNPDGIVVAKNLSIDELEQKMMNLGLLTN